MNDPLRKHQDAVARQQGGTKRGDTPVPSGSETVEGMETSIDERIGDPNLGRDKNWNPGRDDE